MTTPAEAIRRLPRRLPRPGCGRTGERFDELWSICARAPSLGRIAEAHYDAIAILEEAGHEPSDRCIYAVWAAGGPDPATLRDHRLTGSKHWCSGASIATHALITARTDDTNALVLVDLAADGVRHHDSTWRSPAFAATDTTTISFDIGVDTDEVIGRDDWYLTRPGFWHGAIGVAACWAGCADGLVTRLRPSWPTEPHATAHLGAVDADLWSMRATVAVAAAEIDSVADEPRERQRRALRARHIVDATVDDVTRRVMRAVGPGPFAHVPDLHLVLAETDLYRRQSHAERDLEELGRLLG